MSTPVLLMAHLADLAPVTPAAWRTGFPHVCEVPIAGGIAVSFGKRGFPALTRT